MGQVKTFDPQKIIVTFFGFPISGFADGTFVNVTGASDKFNKAMGADGEITRTKTNDYTSEVTISLTQSSLSNDVLSGFVNADRLLNAGKGPLAITDLNGTTLRFWKEAWIKKEPDMGMSKDVETRDWVFDTGQEDQFLIGGNLS